MPRSWPAHGLQFLIGGCTASAFTWWRVSQSWRRVERQFTRDAQLASVPGQFGDNQGSYAYRESCWCDYFPLPVGRSLTADLWCIVKPPSTAQIRKTTAKNDSTTLYMLLKKTPRSIVQLRRLHWRNHQQFHCLRLGADRVCASSAGFAAGSKRASILPKLQIRHLLQATIFPHTPTHRHFRNMSLILDYAEEGLLNATHHQNLAPLQAL